ncbi:MAG: ABC transporter permease [Desulfobacula sp.]|uniref:ABC transporter permease n=1 Tax=Desulfobacula sp. TaxID=2593537 RepID=UPI001D63539F|nr:ABC transporter permease [Desulfobacula sp.]MBT3807033.1 ABC transporter permease [Desulfobacula sp.]MBT4200956.1 ABC transporter permease [Desulfobacula sp.]MBT4508692.1 ABC transporter permease [Desulfobacula sp.]MBT4873696.1 ABC transporter permease [Desulfobacula sp.]
MTRTCKTFTLERIIDSQINNKNILVVKDLDVSYGHVQVLQGVSFSLKQHDVFGIVGRNGMGKTTLCNAIMGLVRVGGGSILYNGKDISNMEPYRIVDLGVSYVPQGRRVWPSLTVDEHLKISSRGKGSWTPARVYDIFPRLAERRKHGGNQLSGGEQQMLAIGRALVGNPKLLIMDEPTEGLAPRIVQHVEKLLLKLAASEDLSILLVEQNLGVATAVAKHLAVMVNGRIETELEANILAEDRALQRRLLGVSSEEDAIVPEESESKEFAVSNKINAPRPRTKTALPTQAGRGMDTINRWSHGNPMSKKLPGSTPRMGVPKKVTRWDRSARPAVHPVAVLDPKPGALISSPSPGAGGIGGAAYVVGTFDTKERELNFAAKLIARQGIRVKTVDLSTSTKSSVANVKPDKVAAYHPQGMEAVFTGDRGSAVSAMAQAFKLYLSHQLDIIGVISLGGSGGTALVAPGLQILDIGIPKIILSTVASGDVAPYVGASDICMLYSVTDVAGINRISERVFSNAANALVGMIKGIKPMRRNHKPAIGLTMFGLTTPCVQGVVKKLEHKYDCLIFHATGTGGRSMEKLVEKGVIKGVIDITTTEVTDLICGGIFSAGEDRMGAIIRSGLPYVGSVGAVDMINFGAKETIPKHLNGRNMYYHNPQVTLVRTTVQESAQIGEWIGNKLNQMTGPVHFFLPEGGLSGLSISDGPFYDPQADAALFEALENTVEQNDQCRITRLPYDINHPVFIDALVESFNRITR